MERSGKIRARHEVAKGYERVAAHWPVLPCGQNGSKKRRADQPIAAKGKPFSYTFFPLIRHRKDHAAGRSHSSCSGTLSLVYNGG